MKNTRIKSIKSRLVNFCIKILSFSIATFILIAPVAIFVYSIIQFEKYNNAEKVFVEGHFEFRASPNPLNEGEYWVNDRYETENSYKLPYWMLLYLCMPILDLLISTRLTKFKSKKIYLRKFKFVFNMIYYSDKIQFLGWPFNVTTLEFGRTISAYIILLLSLGFNYL